MTVLELKTKAAWEDTLAGRRFDFDTRNEYIRAAGWCIATKEVVELLASFIKDKTVIEVMAGTGYLAHHLRQLSGHTRKTYRAYDNRQSYQLEGIQNLSGVVKKNAKRAPIKKADVVIMAWPPYAQPIGYQLLQKLQSGQYFIFNGEGYGGCTADDAFHQLLEKEFVLLPYLTELLDKHHVTWYGIHDRWQVYRKL